MARLALIATVAGAFSGLFGVGGGAVIVPLLILWMSYEEREATGTSLTAIPMIAAIGVLVHGIHGNVHVFEGLVVGVPAIGGVVAGAALQQRVPVRFISAAFAVLLVASAAVLVF
jgi:uncharacterized protein